MSEVNRKPDIVNMLFGSHLYGLSTPASDFDYKGIYMPTLPELLLNNYAGTYKHSTGGAHQKNESGDIDTEVISLSKFLDHACAGETFAIDMLHCENPILNSPIWDDLVEHRTMFYSKSLKAYLGYVKKQAAKYGLKGTRLADIRSVIDQLETFDGERTLNEVRDYLFYGEYSQWIVKPSSRDGIPDQEFYEVNMKKYQSTNTVEYVLGQLSKMWNSYGARAKAAESNNGVDWKALSHALRAGYQARDIYLHGDFEYPLQESEFLLDVKLGKLDYKTEVAPVLESLVEEVDALAFNSDLPQQVNRNYWDTWLLGVYAKHFDIAILVSNQVDTTRTFAGFNGSNGDICPVCHTAADTVTILVPIKGTEDDGVVEARQIHHKCYSVVVNMNALEKESGVHKNG